MARDPHTPFRASRPALLAAVAVVSSLIVSGCGSPPDPLTFERAPIVIVDLSGLRGDRLAGGDVATSRLASLAAESVSFEWTFTPSPLVAPARAALLTGRYPVALGLLAEGGELAPETVTLAQRLGEHGYRTAGFVPKTLQDGSAVAGTGSGFDTWQEVEGGGSLESVVAPALEWMRGVGEHPFLLFVQGSDLLLDGGLSEDDPADSGGADAPGRLEALYAQRLQALDGALGKLLDALDAQGLGARAVVAVTSDRGLELAEHGDGADGDVHTTVARVPLLLRLPGGGGRVEPRITDLVDLAPTLLDLVGLEAADSMQGQSLVAVLDQRGRPPYLAFTDSVRPDAGLAVAMGGYRLVLHRSDDRAELFRLADDPFELTDLAAEEPEKVAVLRRRLEEWQRGLLARGAGGEGDSADDEMIDQLRNLGYIQ